MDVSNHLVNFGYYCQLCKHYDLSEGQEPCYSCLSYATTYGSRRPLEFEAVDTKTEKRLENEEK